MFFTDLLEIQILNREFEALNDKPLSIQNFDILNQISSDSKSKWYSVSLKNTSSLFTLRVTSKSKVASTQQQISRTVNEYLNLLECPKHKNIFEIKAIFEDKAQIYTLFEAAENSLSNLLKRSGILSEEDCRKYIGSLLQVVDSLHSQNPPIIHRNITLEGIFIIGDEIKLANFEHFTSGEEFRNTVFTSSRYVSPEMMKNESYDEKIDIWSVGIIFFQLLEGKNPFQIERGSDFTPDDSTIHMNVGLNQSILFKEISSSSLQVLIRQMLSEVPFQRPPARDLLKSDFFNCKKVPKNIKDNSFTVNFEIIPSYKQTDESFDWSVTQSYMVKQNEDKDPIENDHFRQFKIHEEILSNELAKAKAQSTRNNKSIEKNPFEILLEQHQRIVE
jgi:serine/threonine protein kinase